MTIYAEIPSPCQRLLEPIIIVSKIVEYVINIHRSVIFAYDSNELKEIKIYNTIQCCWIMLFCSILKENTAM